MDFLTYLHDHWSAIAADPWPYLIVALIAGAVVSAFLIFIFRERIETLKVRAEQAEKRLTESTPQTALTAPPPAAGGGELDTQFLLDEQELIIVLKDGHTFFTNRREALQQRLGRSDRKTTVMIVHPDYAHIGAVADMDSNKYGKPDLQIKDCHFAIRTMHELKGRLRADGRDDITKTVKFIGYRQVPVWVGFIGRTHAIVHLYSTRPYAGKLPACNLQRDGNTAALFEWYRNDAEQLERKTLDSGDPWNLWDYKLPSDSDPGATSSIR